MGSQLDPLPRFRVGSRECASKSQFPQLDFVKPSSGFHPVTWERVMQRVGEGVERVYPSVGEDSILIPHDMCCNGPTVVDLIEEVYGALSFIVEYVARSTYIIERAILTPLNEDVDALNKLINDKYAFTKHDGSPARHRVYYSVDSVVHGEQHGIYPTEFLNTLSFSGVSPHELHL